MDTEDKINNPHDKFFKDLFSKKEEACEFLSNYLPEEIKTLIDLSTLAIYKDSFIEKEFNEYFSDILYRVEAKGRYVWIYLLFEHKSYPDELIAYKLLRYMVKIWELLLNQKQITRTFPIIIPLVIYHGTSSWKIGKRFSDLFSHPDPVLSPFIPDFTYQLYDLSTLSDEEIKGAVTLRVFLLLLKYISHDDLSEHLGQIFGLLKEIMKKTTGMEYLEVFLRYIIQAADTVKEDDINKIIEKILPQGGDTIMPTIAEKWIEIGTEKGIRLGLLEGIELDLTLKFGKKGLDLYPRISAIEDLKILRSIKNKLVTAKDVSVLKDLLNG